jgi:hypothetical protein
MDWGDLSHGDSTPPNVLDVEVAPMHHALLITPHAPCSVPGVGDGAAAIAFFGGYALRVGKLYHQKRFDSGSESFHHPSAPRASGRIWSGS